MKWLRWDNGRQLSGYSKLLLASSKLLKFDCYLIKIPNGCEVPEHVDPAVEGYEHHRFNLQLNATCIGTGKFIVHGPVKRLLGGRAILFRPDRDVHYMTRVDFIEANHSVYILSIGWLRRADTKTISPA